MKGNIEEWHAERDEREFFAFISLLFVDEFSSFTVDVSPEENSSLHKSPIFQQKRSFRVTGKRFFFHSILKRQAKESEHVIPSVCVTFLLTCFQELSKETHSNQVDEEKTGD